MNIAIVGYGIEGRASFAYWKKKIYITSWLIFGSKLIRRCGSDLSNKLVARANVV